MLKPIRLIVFAFIVSLSAAAWGQSSVGVFAGLNSSRLSGDAPRKASYKGLMGLNAGGYFDLQLSKAILLSLQPSYSQEGTKIFYNVSGIEEPVDSITIRLSYFSLPLLLKVRSTNKRFYALGGLEAGFLLDQYASSHDVKKEIEANVESLNIAMHFGAGIRIPVGYPVLVIELRYAQGLVNLTDEPVEKSYIPRIKTNGFKVLAGIEFPLQKSNR